MLSQTDARGVTSNNTYDVLNRLKTISYPNSNENVTLTYDNCMGSTNTVGKLCKIVDESGSTQLNYNDKGRLSTKTSIINGVSFTLSYSYNSKGQLTGITYPSGKTVTYTYNNGKVSSVVSSLGDIAKDISYEAFNNRFNTFKFGNSTASAPNTYTRNFNADDYISSISSNALNNSYTFDSRYNITGINSKLASYDDRSRTTSYNNGTDNQSYTYNTSSDRLTDVKNSTTTNYTYAIDSHRLTSLNSSSITYDNNGNTISSAGITYSYNNANRLTSSNNGTVTTTYKYNALGQRVSKSDGATTIYYVYDDDQLIGEYPSATTSLSEHIYLNGVPVGLIQNNNLYYVYVDHLNTPRAISDTSNNSVWTWENNDAFGNNQPSSVLSGFTYNLRFSGQYFDSENNLNYNYYRNYNSLTGRYMQSDPIGLNGGINTYSYVSANSLSFNDPLGLSVSILYIKDHSFLAPDHFAISINDKVYGRDPETLRGALFEYTSVIQESNQVFFSRYSNNSKVEIFSLPINLSSEQEELLEKSIKGNIRTSNYSLLLNNCSQYINSILEQNNYKNKFLNVTPKSLYLGLLNDSRFKEYNSNVFSARNVVDINKDGSLRTWK